MRLDFHLAVINLALSSESNEGRLAPTQHRSQRFPDCLSLFNLCGALLSVSANGSSNVEPHGRFSWTIIPAYRLAQVVNTVRHVAWP
jgi:hypothetical protein